MQDAQTKEETTQLLVPRSHMEMLFHNPIDWHSGLVTFIAPLHPLPLSEVFEVIGMDLVRPLERSAQRHHFVLVLVDYTICHASQHLSAQCCKVLFKIMS